MADHELIDHTTRFTARIQQQDLSILELRKLARERHMQALQPENSPDLPMLHAELAVLEAEISAAQPPIPTPDQTVVALKETNPAAAAALEYNLQRQKIQQELDEAFTLATDHPDNPNFRQRVESNQKALDALGEFPLAAAARQARELREAAARLEQSSPLARSSDEAEQWAAKAQALYSQARQIESGHVPPGGTTSTPADVIAAAEAAVESAMAGGDAA